MTAAASFSLSGAPFRRALAQDDKGALASGRQVHLGTDLGGPDSRINVVIYNSGDAPANATIAVRRTCDDGLADERTVTIPPNTVVQASGLRPGDAVSCLGSSSEPWTRYAVVTVDHPSLSFVSNVTEERAPSDQRTWVPTVGLGVTRSEPF